MYALDRAGGTANDAVTAALRLAGEGRCGEAIAALDGIADTNVLTAPLVARLRRRLDEIVLNGGTIAD